MAYELCLAVPTCYPQCFGPGITIKCWGGIFGHLGQYTLNDFRPDRSIHKAVVGNTSSKSYHASLGCTFYSQVLHYSRARLLGMETPSQPNRELDICPTRDAMKSRHVYRQRKYKEPSNVYIGGFCCSQSKVSMKSFGAKPREQRRSGKHVHEHPTKRA